MKTLITFIIGFFMSAGLAMAQDFEYSFSESYKVSSPVTLKIQTSDGNIEVKPSSGNEIKVYYIARKENRILKISREELEKEVTLIVNHSDNSLEITVQHDQRSSWFGINQVEVGFKILAPAQTACTLRTSDGNISVDGLVSAQDCKTSDGNITVSNIKGQLSGVTSDGNVNMSGITGAVTARSSDGNISLEKISGNIQATTSDGNISLNTISSATVSARLRRHRRHPMPTPIEPPAAPRGTARR